MNQASDISSEKESYSLLWLNCVTIAISVGAIFFYVPTEKTEGIIQRVMYYHVPSAWVAFFAFFIVFITSILFFMEKGKGVGYLCSGFGRDRYRVLFISTCYRAYLGETSLGNLVGLGC